MRVALVASLFVAVGCDFFLGTNEPWPLDAGAGEAGETAAPETNPAGEICPTANLGHTPHTRIANLKFKGYKPTGTSPISLAGDPVNVNLCDFYNPTGKNGNYKVIHIAGAAGWCGPCQHEASDISGFDYTTAQRTGPGIAADVAPLGVVFLEVLFGGDSAGSAQADFNDLRQWITIHQSNFPSVIDPGPTQLRDFLDGKTLPWNADIDARSMEILKSGIGSDPMLEDSLKTLVAKVNSTSPMQ